jgi:hypothetical protein
MTAYSDSFAPPPRLLRMASGGWLAVSASDAPISIGVIWLTSDDARERFATEAAAWRRLLSETPPEPRMGVIAS